MGLFDFFKAFKQTLPVDLTDFKYVSDDHVQYRTEQKLPEHKRNCWRGLRIQQDSISPKNFNFTIYNLDKDKDLWEDNITMPSTQMQVTEVGMSKIILQSSAKQVSQEPALKHRLTIHLDYGAVTKVTLEKFNTYLIDFYRSNMIYGIGPETFDSENDGDVEVLLTPSTNLTGVIAWCEVIGQCKDLKSLTNLYGQKSDFIHPQIYFQFGRSFLKLGDRNHAKRALFKGGRYGLTADMNLYQQEFIDSIGHCLFLLVTEFKCFDLETLYKLTALSYVYLSKAISQQPDQSFDAYNSRALLFNNHPSSSIVQAIIAETGTSDGLIEVNIISDLLIAYNAPRSLHLDAYQTATFIHSGIKDTSIDGIEAWKYTLEGIMEVGKFRQIRLFKTLEDQFKDGTFDVTLEEYKATINHI